MNTLLLTRPIDGIGVQRTRRYARLIGLLASTWAGRMARTMGLAEHEADEAAHVGRAIAARHARGESAPAWSEHCSTTVHAIVAVAERFVMLIDPLDDEPQTPNAALRALAEEPALYDRTAVAALAAQFRLGPSLLPGQKAA